MGSFFVKTSLATFELYEFTIVTLYYHNLYDIIYTQIYIILKPLSSVAPTIKLQDA